MPTIKRIQLLRATSAVRKANTLKVGELLTDLDTKRLSTNDDAQPGGFPHALLRETNLTFATVAGMVAMDHGDYTNGQSVTVAGYYSPGDGGGGLFEWRSGSTSTPDGGSVFTPTSVGGGAGRFHRVVQANEWPTVEMFGGLADGTLTSHVVDGKTYYYVDGQNIRPLVETCVAAYGRVQFGQGVYCFDRVVDLTFVGSGQARIRCTGPETVLALLDATLVNSSTTPGTGEVSLPQWASGYWASDTLFQCSSYNSSMYPHHWTFELNGALIYLNQWHRPTGHSGYVRLPSRFIELSGYGHHIDGRGARVEGFGVARGSASGIPETFLIALALNNYAAVDPPHAVTTSSFVVPACNSSSTVTLTLDIQNGMTFENGKFYFLQDYGFFVCNSSSGSSVTFDHRFFYSTHGLYDATGQTVPSGTAFIRPAFDDGRDFTYYAGPVIEGVHFNGPVASQAASDGFPGGGAIAELTPIMIAGSHSRLFEKPMVRDCHIRDCDYANGAYIFTRPVQGWTVVNNRGAVIEDCTCTNVGGCLIAIDAWICLGLTLRNCRVENSYALYNFSMGSYGFYSVGNLKFGPWWQMRVENCSVNTGNPTGAPNYNGTRFRTTSLDLGSVFRNPRYGQRASADWFVMENCAIYNRPVRQESYVTALIFGSTGGGAEMGDVTVRNNLLTVDRNGVASFAEQVVGAENAGLIQCRRLVWENNTDSQGRPIPVWQQYPETRQGLVWGQTPVLSDVPHAVVEAPDANGRLWLMDYAGYPWALLPWHRNFIYNGASCTFVLPRAAKWGEGTPSYDPLYYGAIASHWLPLDVYYDPYGFDQPQRFYVAAGTEIRILNAGAGTVTVACRKPSDPENLAALVTVGTIASGAVGRFTAYTGATDTYYV